MSQKKDKRSKRDEGYYKKQSYSTLQNRAKRLARAERRAKPWKARKQAMFDAVAEFFRGQKGKAAEWFAAKNPLLGGVAPNTMLRLHLYDKLENFIKNQLEGNRP